jgi:ubiquitin-conjugating enzyme E2 G1
MQLEKNYSEFSAYPSDNNFYKWDVLIFGPPDTIYEGGIFKAEMVFPMNYPNRPPEFRFTSEIVHPNIYKDGKVCISILHEGEDQWGYEKLSERWNPQHGVASVLLSIISMLGDPNFESPADVDASKEWRDNFNIFKKKVYGIVKKSQE